jgi:hypothetical protein
VRGIANGDGIGDKKAKYAANQGGEKTDLQTGAEKQDEEKLNAK